MSAPLRKQRILVYSHAPNVAQTDVSGSTVCSFTVPLSQPLNDVVFLDLAATSQPGYLILLDEARERGVTPGGQPWWRFGSGSQMGRYAPYPEREHEPFQLQRLTITTLNPDGSKAYLPPAVYEIEAYCRVPQQ